MMKRFLVAVLSAALLSAPVVGQSVEGTEINALPAVSTPADTDMLPTDQVGAAETRKITRAQIVAGVLALLQAHEAATGVHGITAFMETLLDDVDATTARATLGLGTAATAATGDFEAAGAVATHSADTTSVHGIADTSVLLDTGDIGSTVQAQDAELAAVAGLVSASGKGIEFTGSGTAGLFDLTTAGKALLDDASASDQRTTLGLGDAATATQGSGNGLDADTVDGSHASAFAASSHNHAGEDVTSGTVAAARLGEMTGDSGAGGAKGAVPAPAAGDAAAGKFLKADATWAAPAGGIGGDLGSTDDCVVRQDGTGGSTVQCGGGLYNPDPSGNVDGVIAIGGVTSSDLALIHNTTAPTELRVVAGDLSGYRVISPSAVRINGGTLDQIDSSGRVGVAANTPILWWDSFPSTSTLALRRQAASVLRVDDGSGSGIASVLSSTLVEANTAGSGAPNVLTATESGTCINNNGATALSYQELPPAATGVTVCGCVTDSDGLRFTAVGDDTIRSGGTVTGAAGYMESTQVGDCWELRAQDSASWYVVSAWPTTASLTLSAP